MTALPCATGTSVALPPASTVICSTAGNAETFTYSGAVPLAAGAISIPVVSQVAGKTHTAADSISGLGLATYAWASGDVATVGQYLLYFKVTMSGGGLYVEDPVPGLVIFAGESLVVTAIIWAESRAERKAWEKQETRKMKAVRR